MFFVYIFILDQMSINKKKVVEVVPGNNFAVPRKSTSTSKNILLVYAYN